MTPPAPAGPEPADGDDSPAEAPETIDVFGDGYEPV